MKTTALIFLTFFLVISGPMNITKKGQKTESEFLSNTPAVQDLNFSNEDFSKGSYSFLSNFLLPEENSEVVEPALEGFNFSSKSISTEFSIFIEKEIGIENWMTELSEFNKDAFLLIENEIQIEDWMTSADNFMMENNLFLEEDLNIEDWMINPYSLKGNSPDVLSIPETEQPFEKWMTEPNAWININNN